MKREVHEVKIKYRCGISKVVDKGGKVYNEYDYDYVNAEMKATKRYNNALCLLMGISGCAVHLLEWLSSNITNGGYVNNNVITRRAFIAFHSKCQKKKTKPYGEDAVNKAFKKLLEENFLVSINKGTYQLNPLMYFPGDGDEEARIKSIRYMMEFKAGVETRFTLEINKR